MNKNFLRIFSFVLIMIFALGVMGFAVSAEEFDIPVIEEVTEGELTEVLPEAEVVELQESEYALEIWADGAFKAGYSTFSEANAAVASGETIKLFADLQNETAGGDKVHINIASGKNFTIDGQGHTWTVGASQSFYVQSSTSVTLVDITIKATADRAEGNFVIVNNGCTLTLGDGATIKGAYNDDGTAVAKNFDIAVNPWNAKASKLVMLDGSKTENTRVLLYSDKNATLDMQGGQLIGRSAGAEVAYANGGSTVKLSGNASTTGRIGYKAASTRIFENYSGTAYIICSDVATLIGGTVEGTYTGHVYWGTSGCEAFVDGTALKWNAGAKVGTAEYVNLREAINTAATGSTITLLEDYTFTSEIRINGKNFVIDGGDEKHTIYENVKGANYRFHLTNAHLEFRNVNIRKQKGNNDTTGYALFFLSAGGKVTLGDYAVVGGYADDVAEYGVGGVIWVEGTTTANKAYFTLNGEGAKIEHFYGKWNGGVFGGSSHYEANLLKGTLNNVTHADGRLVLNMGYSVLNVGDVVITNSKPLVIDDTAANSSIAKMSITGGGTLGTVKTYSSKINFVNQITYMIDKTYTGNGFSGTVTLDTLDETEPASYANVASGLNMTGTVKHVKGFDLVVDENGNLVPKVVATIGDKGYSDLQTAISAVANGETIYLTNNIERTMLTLGNGKTFTIDGQGYTITDIGGKDTSTAFMYAQNGTNVTFKNITLKQTALGPWKGENSRRENGLSAITGNSSITLGDNAVIDGAAGANGGVCWITGVGSFILNGEGAVIKNAVTSYEHGLLATYGSGARIEIRKGKIENCSATANTGCIIRGSGSNRTVIITGGEIINNKVGAAGGAVYAVSGTVFEISGNPTIQDNKTLSNIVGGKETGLKQRNVLTSNNALIRIPSNFNGNVGITTSFIKFGVANAGVTVTGFNRDETTVAGRLYVPGTKYSTDAAKAIIEARNEGKETSVIFDYPFCFANPDADFLDTGLPAASFEGGLQGGKVTYLLRDIKLADVATSGANATTGQGDFHINVSTKNTTYTYDGNGFEFKVEDGNFQKKFHVFRIYNDCTLNLNNFIYDGSNIMGFANADWVSADYLGGFLVMDNCLIKNISRNDGGGIASVTDGSLTATDSVFENIISANNGGAFYIGTPKQEGRTSTLTLENCKFTNVTSGNGAGLYIGVGTTATITGCEFDTFTGYNGAGIRVLGTLNMSDSVIRNGRSEYTNSNGGGLMVWDSSAKAVLTDVTIEDCYGHANGGICLVAGSLELLGNTEIVNCSSGANRAGLVVTEGTTATIGGNVRIATNKTTAGLVANIVNEGTVVIKEDFAGKLGFIKNGTIVVEDGFTSFEKVDSIFLDNDATKYPNITAGKTISWELIPTITIETDAAWLYTDETYTEYASDKAGLVRFATTFVNAPAAGLITNYGTYLVSAETNELGGITTVATFSENTDKIAAESFYVVDAVGIANETTKTIYGLSYVTLKNIDTPIYFDYAIHTIDEEAKKVVVEA